MRSPSLTFAITMALLLDSRFGSPIHRSVGLHVATDGTRAEVPFHPGGVTAAGDAWFWSDPYADGSVRLMLTAYGGAPFDIYRPETVNGWDPGRSR
ncbi:MAG: hypothetical protein IT385_15550 [Deltaproteobacteria bacterium]|nr:hypothetical protein [Deltaproteobacteria bacterium]